MVVGCSVLAVAFNPVAQRPVALIQIRAPLNQVVPVGLFGLEVEAHRTIRRIVWMLRVSLCGSLSSVAPVANNRTQLIKKAKQRL